MVSSGFLWQRCRQTGTIGTHCQVQSQRKRTPLPDAILEPGGIPRNSPPPFKRYVLFESLILASISFHCTSSFKRCAPRTVGTYRLASLPTGPRNSHSLGIQRLAGDQPHVLLRATGLDGQTAMIAGGMQSKASTGGSLARSAANFPFKRNALFELQNSVSH